MHFKSVQKIPAGSRLSLLNCKTWHLMWVETHHPAKAEKHKITRDDPQYWSTKLHYDLLERLHPNNLGYNNNMYLKEISQSWRTKLNISILKIQCRTQRTWYSKKTNNVNYIIFIYSASRKWNSTRQYSIQFNPMSVDEAGSYKEQIIPYPVIYPVKSRYK